MMQRIYISIFGAACCVVLASCGSSDTLRENLGLNHKAPDEYRVYARPPLSVPPEFNLTAPTAPGHGTSEYSSGVAASDQAHGRILGENVSATPSPFTGISPAAPTTISAAVPSVLTAPVPSASDAQFLNNAGALQADPHIRERIEDDKFSGGVPTKDSTYLVGNKKTGEDTLVDATKEADRLSKDKAQNQPPTTGDTPVIEPKGKGLLGEIGDIF